MSVRKRGRVWQVRVSGFPDESFPTKAAADLVDLDRRLRKKLGPLYGEKACRFGDELRARLERKKSMGGRRGKLRPATVSFYEQCVAPWKPLYDVELPNLRRAAVEDHVAARARLAPVAARNELQFAKAALRDAASRGQQVDPGIFAIEPIHHEAAEGEALTVDQLDSIAAWLPERIGRVVQLCGLVGLRWSEAIHLDESMLDLEHGQLVIPRSLNKSRRSKPIPLASGEVQLLREQLMARPVGTRLVFPNAKGGAYSKSGFRSVWAPALESSQLAGFKFHWLRHTAISLMACSGMTPEFIALRVGHSDGGTLIYRRYRHLFPSELRAAVSRFDDFVKAARATESGQEAVGGI